ncbi:hypothetical protein CRH03_12585 [Clostridium sp. HMb25]|nr:hypothetical protein CRH03_12585 [Clostridium sp. HMb25]
MLSIKKKTFKYSTLHLILGCCIVLWINGGLINYLFVHIPDVFKMVIFLMWICIAVTYDKCFFNTYLLKSVSLFAFCGVLIAAVVMTDLNTISYYLKVCVFLLMINAIYIFYSRFYTEHSRAILYVVAIDSTYIIINTLIHLINSPNLSRYLSMSEDKIVLYLGRASTSFIAIGNYTFAYGIVFLGFFFLYRTLTSKKNRILFTLLYFFMYLVLIKMEFTIALLLYALSSLLYFCLIGIKERKKFILILLMFMAANVIFIIGIPIFLQSIAKYFPEGIAIRLNEIGDMFNKELSNKADLKLRLVLYYDSLNSFIQNILGGCLLNQEGSIGGHSTILDFLGSFGLLTFPIFIYFGEFYLTTLKYFKGNIRKIYITGIFYFVTLSIVNTTFSPRILLYAFLVFPLLLLQERKYEESMYHS